MMMMPKTIVETNICEKQKKGCGKIFVSKVSYYKDKLRTVAVIVGSSITIIIAVWVATMRMNSKIILLENEIKNMNKNIESIIEGKTRISFNEE
jgi:hypothetical protein